MSTSRPTSAHRQPVRTLRHDQAVVMVSQTPNACPQAQNLPDTNDLSDAHRCCRAAYVSPGNQSPPLGHSLPPSSPPAAPLHPLPPIT